MIAPLDLVGQFNAYGPMFLLGLVALGLLVGGMTGLFGVGGAFLVTPLLMVFGMDETTAVGSSLCFVIGTSAAGLRRHWRLGNVEGRSLLVIGLGSVGGALLGSMLHVHLKGVLGEGEGLNFPILMRVCYLVLLPVTAVVALRGPREHHSGKSLLQRFSVGPRMSLPAAGQTGVSLTGLVLLGVGVGVMTGLLGVGGGVLYMPLLLVLVALRPQQAVGTSLGVILFSAITGTVRFAIADTVNVPVAMALLLGSAIGVQGGAAICARMHGQNLRKYFAVVVLVATVIVAASLANKIFGSVG